MTLISLQTLTWGTVGTAFLGTLLLAANASDVFSSSEQFSDNTGLSSFSSIQSVKAQNKTITQLPMLRQNPQQQSRHTVKTFDKTK